MGLTLRFLGWLCLMVVQFTMWQQLSTTRARALSWQAPDTSGTHALGCAPQWMAALISSVPQLALHLRAGHPVVAHVWRSGVAGYLQYIKPNTAAWSTEVCLASWLQQHCGDLHTPKSGSGCNQWLQYQILWQKLHHLHSLYVLMLFWVVAGLVSCEWR